MMTEIFTCDNCQRKFDVTNKPIHEERTRNGGAINVWSRVDWLIILPIEAVSLLGLLRWLRQGFLNSVKVLHLNELSIKSSFAGYRSFIVANNYGVDLSLMELLQME